MNKQDILAAIRPVDVPSVLFNQDFSDRCQNVGITVFLRQWFSWALADGHHNLCKKLLSFMHGDRQSPESSAYLKRWQALTRIGHGQKLAIDVDLEILPLVPYKEVFKIMPQIEDKWQIQYLEQLKIRLMKKRDDMFLNPHTQFYNFSLQFADIVQQLQAIDPQIKQAKSRFYRSAREKGLRTRFYPMKDLNIRKVQGKGAPVDTKRPSNTILPYKWVYREKPSLRQSPQSSSDSQSQSKFKKQLNRPIHTGKISKKSFPTLTGTRPRILKLSDYNADVDSPRSASE